MKFLKTVVVVILFCIPGYVLAQDDFPPDVNDNDVPFDGGVSLLVAAGIGYGLKKVYDKKKEDEQ